MAAGIAVTLRFKAGHGRAGRQFKPACLSSRASSRTKRPTRARAEIPLGRARLTFRRSVNSTMGKATSLAAGGRFGASPCARRNGARISSADVPITERCPVRALGDRGRRAVRAVI